MRENEKRKGEGRKIITFGREGQGKTKQGNRRNENRSKKKGRDKMKK